MPQMEVTTLEEHEFGKRTRRQPLGWRHAAGTILTLLALKWSSPLLLPAGMAMVMLMTFLPVRHWCRGRWGPKTSGLLTFFSSIVVLALGCYLLWLGYDWNRSDFQEVLDMAGQDPTVRQLFNIDSEGLSSKLFSQIAALSALLPALGIFFFLLLEYEEWKNRLAKALPETTGESSIRLFEKLSWAMALFWIGRTVAGLVTGTIVTLECLWLGIELAVVWGLANFLLNYIPTVGSVVASFLPPAYVLMQGESPTRALLVLAVVGGTQVVLGTFIDPLIQDKFLKLSALTIFVAVIAFGWIWGPWGALIGVPLVFTAGFLLREFPQTHAFGILAVGEREVPEFQQHRQREESDSLD